MNVIPQTPILTIYLLVSSKHKKNRRIFYIVTEKMRSKVKLVTEFCLNKAASFCCRSMVFLDSLRTSLESM